MIIKLAVLSAPEFQGETNQDVAEQKALDKRVLGMGGGTNVVPPGKQNATVPAKTPLTNQ